MTDALTRTLSLIEAIPGELPVALLLRHSARDAIPDGDAGLALPLNEAGVRMCQKLGSELRGKVSSARSSPVLRCTQTAKVLSEAANYSGVVGIDRLLGGPGAYVLNEEAAWNNWLAKGNDGVIEHLVSGVGALPGMADPTAAAISLVNHILVSAGTEQGLHLFISHDSIVAPTVARMTGKEFPQELWPEYLDAVAFWHERDGVRMCYRGMSFWRQWKIDSVTYPQ